MRVIVLLLCISILCGFTYNESISIPVEYETLDNGKEDYFYTSLQVLSLGGASYYANWNSVVNETRVEFEMESQQRLERLYSVYADPYSNNSDIGNITLEYLDFVVEFSEKLIAPVTMDDGTTIFTLPTIAHHYLTYMPVQAITNETSAQWRFKPYLTTDARGYKRYGDAYAIALGSYFGTEIGTVYEITFADQKVITAVLADCKADIHTDLTHRYANGGNPYDGSQGNIIEFVMDHDFPFWAGLTEYTRMSAVGSVMREDFVAEVIKIRRVGKVDVLL